MKARRSVPPSRLREALTVEDIPDQLLAELAEAADEVAVPPGYVLVYEGRWGDEAFIVADGAAEIAAGGRTLAVLGPGSVLAADTVRSLVGPEDLPTVTASSAMRFFVIARTALPTIARP